MFAFLTFLIAFFSLICKIVYHIKYLALNDTNLEFSDIFITIAPIFFKHHKDNESYDMISNTVKKIKICLALFYPSLIAFFVFTSL